MNDITKHFDVSGLSAHFGVTLPGTDATELYEARAQEALERWDALPPVERDTVDAVEVAWDLLSCWGALRRIRPALRDQRPAFGITTALASVMKREGHVLAKLVLDNLPSVAAWLESAQAYADDADDPVAEEGVRSRAARELLSDLDDATVVAAVLEALGLDPPSEWSDSLTDAIARVNEDPGVWFPAWMWIAECRASFDPDLAEADPALALTQDNFLGVLDGLEEVIAWEPRRPADEGCEVDTRKYTGREPIRNVVVLPIRQPPIHSERHAYEMVLAAMTRTFVDPTADSQHFMLLRDGSLRLAWCEVVHDEDGWRPARDDDESRPWALAVSLSGIALPGGVADVVPNMELSLSARSLQALTIIRAPTQLVLVAAVPGSGDVVVLVDGVPVAIIPVVGS